MTADDQHLMGEILLAALRGPSTGVYSHTYAPSHVDEYADCPACGAAWDGCDASQPFALEGDEACCGGCEHEWIGPPAPYVITKVGGDREDR